MIFSFHLHMQAWLSFCCCLFKYSIFQRV